MDHLGISSTRRHRNRGQRIATMVKISAAAERRQVAKEHRPAAGRG